MDKRALSRQYIDGVWCEGRSETVYSDVNPYSQESIAQIRFASVADIDDAYHAALRSQPNWGKTSAYERSALLQRVAGLLEQKRQDIVQLIVEELGGTQVKAHVEIDIALGMLRAASDLPLRMEGSIRPSMIPGKENRIYRLPIGVVGVISPFNFPLALSIRSVAPAIAAGNAVVLKPDPQTFLTGGSLVAQLFEQAGLPAGVLNMVVPDIAEVGDAFVEHPIPRLISFTGSTAVGRRIGEICGRHLKRVALELGGNNVMIVLADADVEQAVRAAIFGKFMHQGQICMCLNRILVHRNVYDSFVEKFVAHASQLKAGDPADPSVTIGPLINRRQAEKVARLIEAGEREGARVVLRGTIEGCLVRPFVLADVRNDMEIAQHEVFGPVASIIPFDDEEEAIRVANESEHGLSGSVFSRDLEHGVDVALRIQTGMVHVNDQSINDEPNVAFGGEKASGLGRFGAEWSLEEFTTVRWVSVQRQPRVYPF
ncbi:MAG: aldehyde dehydrogenase family protein [Alicyclobacillus shizuokensis]|nr:aldehyde dehydrogenase family protein [Alicyclobacillus shizuokensis]MCL6625216.1 aldehyde dehydrogenase family protein [Alicyclobacillus shizuokensis]